MGLRDILGIAVNRNSWSWTFPFFSGSPEFKDWSVEDAVRQGYKSNSYVYRCIKVIADNVTVPDWYVYSPDAEDNILPLDNHDIYRVMESPNQHQTNAELFEMIATHLCLCGNAVIVKIRQGNNRGSGRVIGLIPISPDIVVPVIDNDYKLTGYEIVYGDKQNEILPIEDVIHIKLTNPANLYWGQGPLQAVEKIVDVDNEAVAWNKVAMENRGVSDGVFSVEDELTETQYETIRNHVRNEFTGSKNARKPLVLSGTRLTWHPMSKTPAELDFMDSRKMNREEICAAFGVPPVLVEIYEHAIYNNMKEAKYVLWHNTIIPLLDKIKDAFNKQLLEKDFPAGDAIFDYDLANVSAMEKSFTEKVQNAERLFRMGVPFNAVNQELELGFEEVEGGDTAYLPSNLIPTGDDPFGQMSNDFGYIKKKSINSRELKRTRYERALASRLVSLIRRSGSEIASAYIQGGDEGAREQAEKMQEPIRDELYKMYRAVTEDIGKETYDEVMAQKGMKAVKDIDPWNLMVSMWVEDLTNSRAWMVTEAFKADVIKFITEGIETGQGPDAVARTLRKHFDDMSMHRAMRIARTETVCASNHASELGAMEAGATEKVWVTSVDERTRESHVQANGQKVPIDSTFRVGNELLEHPGDPTGAPEEIIHCRCTMSFR